MKEFNKMKTVLGLDLGTNSIGWALIVQNRKTKNPTECTRD